jgi:hypothetical protein
MIFISTLVVQLVIALFHSQIVHAVHAGIWLHAGVLPAVLQGTLDQLGVSRVLRHGGERQHVLHLQFAGLTTSVSVEIRAALIVTNPVLVHGPVRVFLLGLGQGSLGLSVGLGCVGCEKMSAGSIIQASIGFVSHSSPISWLKASYPMGQS